MTLQAKVTLGSVLLATIIVTLVSGVDLGSFMELQLQATLERADVIKDVAKDAVHRDRSTAGATCRCAKRCAIRSSSASC